MPDLAYLLRRHAGLIACVTALCIAAALCTVLITGPRYTATARLVAALGSARQQAELLRDPNLLARALPRTRAGHALRAATVSGTDIIDLSFTWRDPTFAAAALNWIVVTVQKDAAQAAQAADATQRNQARLQELANDLAALDRQFLALPEGGDPAGLKEARARLEGRLAAARGTADQARLDRALAQRNLETIEHTYRTGGWVDGATAGDPNDATRPLAAGFTALLEKRQALMESGETDSAAMRALDREMARGREQAFASSRQIAAARVAALDDRLGVLRDGIADNEAALGRLDQQSLQAEMLTAARLAKAAQLAEARKTIAQSTAAAAGQAAAPRLVSAAVPPTRPDFPGPFAMLWLCAVLGFAGGLASAAWLEARRLTVDRPSDLPRRLGIEILARLDEMPPLPVR